MTQFPDLSQLFSNSQYWHQFISHFPFCLWLVATLLFLLSLNARFQWLYLSALVTGVMGSLLGGVAWWTGEKLSRGTWKSAFSGGLVSSHQENAYTAFVAFSAVFVLASFFRFLRTRFPNSNFEGTWTRVAFVAGLAFGTFYLCMSTQEGVQLASQKQTYIREVLNAR